MLLVVTYPFHCTSSNRMSTWSSLIPFTPVPVVTFDYTICFDTYHFLLWHFFLKMRWKESAKLLQFNSKSIFVYWLYLTAYSLSHSCFNRNQHAIQKDRIMSHSLHALSNYQSTSEFFFKIQDFFIIMPMEWLYGMLNHFNKINQFGSN